MKATLSCLIAAALLSGCAGSRFKMANARKVEVGMTEQQVTKLMGRPYSVVSKGEEQIWIWSQANGLTGSSQSVSFIMRDRKVVSVPTIPDSFK